ncbi:MAG: S1C family serine protease [Terrimicrobiaceae bacterium]
MRFRPAVLLGAVAILGSNASAEEMDLAKSLSDKVSKVFQDRSAAVVRVEATDRHGRLNGTGFFADPMGTVYTVYSTVAEAREVFVVVQGRRLPATVLTADARSGIALLKVDIETTFIPAASSASLRLASPLVAIGFPMDLEASPSFGILGGFDKKFQGRFLVSTHIRANLPVQSGFGGAPLLNLQGEVVGIIIAGLEGGSSCFALPIEAAEKIRKDFVRFGEARHGWIGVTVESMPGDEVHIAELGPETPASQSGLKEGDILLQVGNVAIKNVEDVLDASFFLTDGDAVAVRVIRGGQELQYSIRPALHPASEKSGLHAAGTSPEFNLLSK